MYGECWWSPRKELQVDVAVCRFGRQCAAGFRLPPSGLHWQACLPLCRRELFRFSLWCGDSLMQQWRKTFSICDSFIISCFLFCYRCMCNILLKCEHDSWVDLITQTWITCSENNNNNNNNKTNKQKLGGLWTQRTCSGKCVGISEHITEEKHTRHTLFGVDNDTSLFAVVYR